jgi:uncharacterized membrane protein
MVVAVALVVGLVVGMVAVVAVIVGMAVGMVAAVAEVEVVVGVVGAVVVWGSTSASSQ